MGSRRGHIAWLTCLALLAGIGLSRFGGELCLAEGGHVEIESFCQPCCSDSENACRIASPVEEHSHHNECNDCTDLPVVQESVTYRCPRPDRPATSATLANPTTPHELQTNDTSGKSEFATFDIGSGDLTGSLLATVILLC